MKVLFVLNATTINGGATKSFLSMVDQLIKNNVVVGVLCPDKKGVYNILKKRSKVILFDAKYRAKIINRPHAYINIKGWLKYLYRIYINKKAFDKLKNDIIKFNPDIIHENTSVTDMGYKFAKFLHKPYIIHIREYCDKDFNWYNIGLDNRLNYKLSHSISITKDIQRHRKQHENPKAFQLYNGIVSVNKIRYSSVKDSFFLFAGRIEEAKGVFDLLETYNKYKKQLEKKNLRPLSLKLAGLYNPDAQYFKKCLDFINCNSLEPFVEWLGDQKEIDNLYFKTCATIIPSKFEGLGRVLGEALSNGSLCICRNAGGLKEQMDIGKDFTGDEIALKFNSNKELEQILINVTNEYYTKDPFENNGIFEQTIRKGQEFIKEFLTIESYGQKILAMYNKIYNGQNNY